ncbi:DNA ligase D [Pseudomonas mangiferae]|uniref:DNA ligase (ATP) n=1 Tax=Pseudomonas mangiferae TaxID=2593654 RepID=A0A553H177_9PSED|nr:DNA ligase D [Pseudomonas mangiferae]TRX75505.1 DNA ligase D [Pseudomonas mangiferae]
MATALDEYARKRDFLATPEPSGKRSRGRQAGAHALQFCIQKHDASHLHYDFRLELQGTLKSWAIPKGPCLDPKVRRLAIQVEDHPLDYAGFEGHIPEGHYGAGDVIVWDRGIWVPQGDPIEGYAKGRLKFELHGEKLNGLWNLVRTHLEGRKTQWFLIKSHDEQARAAQDYDILEDRPDSVLSDRTLPSKPKPAAKTPARKNRKTAADTRKPAQAVVEGGESRALPDVFTPQLATLVDAIPEGDWSYEIKFDGYRILARVDGDDIRLFTRNGNDWTARMPRQVEALRALGVESAWLDGEMVVTNAQGNPDFQALQNAFEDSHSGRIAYYLFDVPYLNGTDLRDVPVEQRRAALDALLKDNRSPLLRYSTSFDEAPEKVLANACRMKLEGLIGKRLGSPYSSKRSADWIKLKCKQRQEFVIVGYSDPKGTRSAIGALLLGLHDSDSRELRFAGKVGTGFNAVTLKNLLEKLQPLQRETPAAANAPKGYQARGVHWLEPTLMCEVAFAEMTREGIVRQAVFHGLRNDKPAKAISQERPVPVEAVESRQDTTETVARRPKAVAGSTSTDNQKKQAIAQGEQPVHAKPTRRSAAKQAATPVAGKVRITHPERIIDESSGFTKRDLAEYYGRIAPWALPWLEDRPVALVRGPEGIGGELFFQKHAARLSIPYITQLDPAYEPEHPPLMVIESAEALVGAAQMGTLELHTWNATVPKLEKPDRFVLDLDPDPALPWKAMVEATQLTLTLLDELGLRAFIKTSGGKGMHVVVPLTRRLGWEPIKAFSQAIAQHLARLMPDRFSATSGPKNRVGRIFIDYLRNTRGASTVSPYSARAREGLPVSVPIHREELTEIKGASAWDIRTVLARLETLGDDDPWAELRSVRQSITADMRARMGLKTR